MLTTESLDEIREAADLDTDADRETIHQTLEVLTIAELSQVISADWERPYFGAVPYLRAMSTLEHIQDDYGCEPARMIVAYFQANAKTWRGPLARAVKAELKRRQGR